MTAGDYRLFSIIYASALADIRPVPYMYWAGREAAGATHNGETT